MALRKTVFENNFCQTAELGEQLLGEQLFGEQLAQTAQVNLESLLLDADEPRIRSLRT